MSKKLRSAFVAGVLVLVPILVTIYILLWFVGLVDNSVRQFVPLHWLPFDFKGLGLIVVVIFIPLVGVVAQTFLADWLISKFEGTIKRISVIGGIYSAVKKFMSTLFNPQGDKFKGCVLVEFPRAGIHSIGFRTGTPDSHISAHSTEKMANVFVPCTPNPTSGFYIVVPEKDLIALNISVQEAFKIVVSMGLVNSEHAIELQKK